MLHVVFTPLPAHAPLATPLPLGGSAPIAVLGRDAPPGVPAASGDWPCARLALRLGVRRVRELLLAAGRARFAQREARFMRDLAEAEAHTAAPAAFWAPRDRALFVAIAEALGYGRDRDALRATGAALVSGDDPARACVTPGAAGRVERARVGGLLELRERWLGYGPWARLATSLVCGSPRSAAGSLAAELSVVGGSVSPGRARIVAANVVLPFASAVAALDGDKPLGRRALAVYEVLPGLPSNQITRLMALQLGLPRLPSGAAAQQGLQHVWSEWCREKRCDACPCASTSLPDVPSPRHDTEESVTLSEENSPEIRYRPPASRCNFPLPPSYSPQESSVYSVLAVKPPSRPRDTPQAVEPAE